MTVAQDNKSQWLSIEQKYLPVHFQLAQLLDLVMSANIPQHKILRGTGLFYEDLVRSDALICPKQMAVLVANTQQYLSHQEVSFRWGASLWPGYAGVFSQSLGASESLLAALETLKLFRHWLSPVVVPDIHITDTLCLVYWKNTYGVDEKVRRFFVEAYMSALVSLTIEHSVDGQSHWRCGVQHLDANGPHRVYLGEHVSCLNMDVMVIERREAEIEWRKGSMHLRELATQQALTAYRHVDAETFPEAVQVYLSSRLSEATSVAVAAEAFSMSCATLKRRLSAYGTHFQALLDEVRMQHSLYLIHVLGWSNERIADYLNVGDSANFRRAFKRWTGLSPSASRDKYASFIPRQIKSNQSSHTNSELPPSGLPEYAL